MSTGTKSLLVVVILLLGFVAALPFQRKSSLHDVTTKDSTKASKKEPLRPLEFVLAPEKGESPTQPIFKKEGSVEPASLGNLSPPPELGSTFPSERQANASSSTHSGSKPEQKHVIGLNETLFDIAKKFWGKGDLYLEIYKANVDVLINANDLPVGREIVIPDLPDQTPKIRFGKSKLLVPIINWKSKSD